MNQDLENEMDKPVFDPMDLVDKPIGCVYGPPEWYDRHGNLNDNHISFDSMVDKPISCVYGPLGWSEWYCRRGHLDDNRSSPQRFRGWISKLIDSFSQLFGNSRKERRKW